MTMTFAPEAIEIGSMEHADDYPVHIYCCDPEVALCGEDLTNHRYVDDHDESQECRECAQLDLEGRGCKECDGGSTGSLDTRTEDSYPPQ